MKRCTKCRREKAVREFYRTSDGRFRRSWCKDCFCAAGREYRANHPEAARRALIQERRRYHEDPEFRARRKRASRRWAREHPGRKLEYARRERVKYRAKVRARAALKKNRSAK